MKNIIVEFIITKWERLSVMLPPSAHITHHDIQWRKDAMMFDVTVYIGMTSTPPLSSGSHLCGRNQPSRSFGSIATMTQEARIV